MGTSKLIRSKERLKKDTRIVMEYEIIGLTKVDKDWLDARPNLKVIGCNCTGLDHIDLKECEKRGIKVISLRDYPFFMKFITSTAEHTFGLIIAFLFYQNQLYLKLYLKEYYLYK